MKQYVPSTIVQPTTRIRIQRLLPHGGEVIVRVGQDVSPLQALARAPQTTRFFIVPAAQQLGVPPDELAAYLKVQRGEKMESGMLLAERQRFLGTRQVLAPADGELMQIENGRLLIQQFTDWHELRAMVKGRVVNYVGTRGVILEVVGARIQAAWSSGEAILGPLRVVGESPETVLTGGHIVTDLINHVMAVGRIQHVDYVSTAVDSGVRGIIAGSMPASVALAARQLPITILLTEGIGEQPMATHIFDLLMNNSAQDTSLFAQDSYGGQERPDIVIPNMGVPRGDQLTFNQPLSVGQQVRILRAPHTSQVGMVEKIYKHLHTLPTGDKVRGAEVRLPDGQLLFVPTVNLDVIL